MGKVNDSHEWLTYIDVKIVVLEYILSVCVCNAHILVHCAINININKYIPITECNISFSRNPMGDIFNGGLFRL